MWRPEQSSSGAAPPQLVTALLSGDLGRVVKQPWLLRGLEEQLAEVRRENPVVEWFGVNERRVDVLVSTSSDQYRIVYFTEDGETIDTLSVFRRPPRVGGVVPGRVVCGERAVRVGEVLRAGSDRRGQ